MLGKRTGSTQRLNLLHERRRGETGWAAFSLEVIKTPSRGMEENGCFFMTCFSRLKLLSRFLSLNTHTDTLVFGVLYFSCSTGYWRSFTLFALKLDSLFLILWEPMWRLTPRFSQMFHCFQKNSVIIYSSSFQTSRIFVFPWNTKDVLKNLWVALFHTYLMTKR